MENVEVEDTPNNSEKQESIQLDEMKNQAGPSVPLMPTTPRGPPLKALQSMDSPEPEAKKFKQTAIKPVHELQGSTASEAKRMKSSEGAHQERRVMETQVGDDVFAHQDEVLSKEEIEAWLMEAEE